MKKIWYDNNNTMYVRLNPEKCKQKSFYGKAFYAMPDTDTTQYILYSYNTPVLFYMPYGDNGEKLIRIYDETLLTHTTLKHVKEFLQQKGCKIGTKSELIKMYCK